MYSVYGLTLETSRPIHELIGIEADRPAEVRVSFEGLPQWLADISRDRREVLYAHVLDGCTSPLLTAYRIWSNGYYHFCYCDKTEFLISGDGSQVWAQWPEELTLEDTCVYLLGPVLGFVLQLRGKTSLHASAVVVDDYALALLGPAAAGKSTIAAMLAIQGHPVLSDDVLTLVRADWRFIVQPGYPLLRLWPQSAQILFGSPSALPRLTPTWDKLFLDLMRHPYCFESHPKPLGAIYVLGERADCAAAPYVEPLESHPALIALIANTYSHYMHDQARRARDFGFLGQLAASVPLRKIVPHTSPDRLHAMCELIVDDFRSLGISSVARQPRRITVRS